MKKTSLTLSILLLFAGCSSENEDLKKKSLDLEKENGNLKKKILDLERENEFNLKRYHQIKGKVVDHCTATQEEITTFGAYTLTQTIIDQDWYCIDDLTGEVSVTGGGYWEPSGVNRAVVSSPEKDLVFSVRELTVNDIGDFYHVSGYHGGAWCCVYDYFLSKKAPYEIVFEEVSKADEGVLVEDFDDDGRKEIEIEQMHFLHWRGTSTGGSAQPVIYLEYSSDSFNLDKDLTYTKANEKIKNTKPDELKFYPHGSGYEFGWQGHFIPRTLIEIIAPLIMAGREEEAREFLEDKWPDNLTDMELFFSLLKEQVKKSKYWDY